MMFRNLINSRAHAVAFGAVLALSVVASAGKSFTDPLILKLLVDRALGHHNFHLFIIVIVGGVGISLALRIFEMMSGFMAYKLIRSIKRDTVRASIDQFLSLPSSSVGKHGAGYFLSRIADEPMDRAEKSISVVITATSSIIIVACSLLVCLWLSWKVTAILLVTVPFLRVAAVRFGNKIRLQSGAESESLAIFKAALTRCINSFKTTRIFSIERRVKEKLDGPLDSYLDTSFNRQRTAQIYQTSSFALLCICEACVLSSSAAAVFFGSMTIGGLLAYMGSFWKMTNAFVLLVTKLPDAYQVLALQERFERLGETRETVALSPGDDIKLANFNFGYEKSPLFSNFNLHIRRGSRTLIVGSNGSGKTSLLNLVCGFLESEAPLQAPALARISAMLNPFEFANGTLRDNLAFDDRDPERQALIMQILAAFGLGDLLDDDPNDFSSGQKQKAYILMCLSKDADLYIFDEPLSAIDVASKSIIMDTIIALTVGKTLVVVLHGDEQFHRAFERVALLDHSLLVSSS
jgi:ABC-type bacteriocin/lantibiotic exporter with double-glycine peptidase domain